MQKQVRDSYDEGFWLGKQCEDQDSVGLQHFEFDLI